MSKAEDKAMQYCCTKCANNKLNCGMKLISHRRNCIECSNYIAGYHQAEKDLELSWEDLKLLQDISHEVFAEVANGSVDYYQIYPTEQSFLEEVLKRYKERKEE